MESGLYFKALGKIGGKRSWPDKETKLPVFGADVGWMGGSEFFRLSPEQYAACGEKGSTVLIEGTMEISKFGVRFSVESLKNETELAQLHHAAAERAAKKTAGTAA